MNLADDTFHRSFPDSIPITPEAQSLPDMQGSGLVRDLREAASQSGALAGLLAQYAAAPTRAAQLALLDQVLDAWADTSNLAERLEERSSQYRFRYMGFAMCGAAITSRWSTARARPMTTSTPLMWRSARTRP